MSNNFCRHLSNGYNIDVKWDNTLQWRPCCHYAKSIPLLDKQAIEKELAYTSSATGWLPECRACQQMENSEASATHSPRIFSFYRNPTELETGECGSLQLSFDASCNAACLSCGSYISDTWKKYEYKHGIRDIGPIINHADRLADQLIANVAMDKLDEIFILGGEPFYSGSGNKILRHLRNTHPDISKVKLRYQTNGSIIPDLETRALWEGFGSLAIGFSLDGVGERFDYLRWPLKWTKVEQTVANILETTNAIVTTNCTINPFNGLYFQEIVDWATATIPANRRRWLDHPVRPNRANGILDLNKTPMALREDIIKTYGVDHILSKIISNLEFSNNAQEMLDYVSLHDQIRKLDWRRTFPDVVKYFA